MENLKSIALEHGKILSARYNIASRVENPKGDALENVAPRTEVKLALHPAPGSDVKVELWLPDAERWNGRFLGLGNGGGAGSINAAVLAGPLSEGYAVATTDMGTAHTGIGNPEVWKDFGFRSTHLMTVAAKQIAGAFYGKKPLYAYFVGASTGGQQGLQEAQSYPGDYDGIVAGVPAHCRAPLHAYFLWNEQIFRHRPFTDSQKANVVAAGLEFMASKQIPALAGKAIADPRATDQDREAVIRLAMNKDPTLTGEHAEALRKLFGGPVHAVTGERIFGGIPFGSSFDIATGHLYLFQWVFGADKDLMSLDFGNDIDAYFAALSPLLNAENPDLRPFAERGGKMIAYSGAADSCVPYHATLDYYERVAEKSGDIEDAQRFFKYYIVPGMAHGPGPVINVLPKLLDLVVDWRENGNAPEELRVRRVAEGKTEIDIPIYPYPAQTVWDKDSSSYNQAPAARGGVGRVADRFRQDSAREPQK